MMDSLYITSVKTNSRRYKLELDELAGILNHRNWSPIEYRACERSLQVSIEACIGVSKHWCKKLAKRSPVEAYEAFELLSQYQYVSLDELTNWRKIIGLRNALVHDYLNIDPEIVRSVIINRYYNDIFIFIEKGLKELSE
ncbi:DUF86 domain-containing protein [Marinomonas mediterranea]|uniref:type VII toxin-antitoxin system HepT family RNase toxin n=1 Tax=Marinomonas mediterranea TaxID=119864 RepID=UPI00234BD614|nr:DUF86 domain-containing protein [Marinomonas mediterranea]WCN14266.1 DUF86 domain-containing protein [Marinomonas mediterranea]